MSTTTTTEGRPPIACPSCGTRYRWRDEFAGKELNCKCGTAFRAPSLTPGAASSSKPAPPPLQHPYALPVGGKSAVQRALEAREDEAQLSRVREFIVPVILLPVGAFAGLVGWTQLTGQVGEGLLVTGVMIALQALVFTPLAFWFLTATARWFEMALGLLPAVLFKTAALTLGAAAMADVIFLAFMVNTDFDWWCVVAGYAVYMILCGVPAMYLFEMQVYEAALWMLLNFLPRVIGAYIVAATIPDYFT